MIILICLLNKIDNFNMFAQNIDCGFKLEPPLTSINNLCFGTKIRKIGIPLHAQVKRGELGGIHFTDMFS